MKFRFGIKDSKLMLNHLLLGNSEIAEKVAETELWSESGVLEAEVKINGIPVPPQAFDALLKEIFKQAQVDSGKEAFESAVEARAKQLVEEQAGHIIEAMTDLHNKISDVDNIIKYVWEK